MATRTRTGAYKVTVLGDAFKEGTVVEENGWLWPDRIPAGSMGMFDGDGGLGKSMVTMDLAARVTTGAKWPDGAKGIKASDVLVIAAEDSHKTIANRLRAAGADLNRVIMLDEVNDPDDGRARLMKLPNDISIVEKIVRERKVKLVIIDPIMAYLAVHSGSDQKVREALTPLAKVAERTGATIVFVRHLNKTTGRNAKMAGGGSVGMLAACRFGYLFAEDPEAPTHRIIAFTKFNLGAEPKPLRYHIEDKGQGPLAVWHKDEEVKWSANDLLKHRAVDVNERTERNEVVAFLEDFLAENGGAVWPKELFKEGAEWGFTQKMLRTAKGKLGVKSVKRGDSWLWVTPEAAKSPAKLFSATSKRHLKAVD